MYVSNLFCFIRNHCPQLANHPHTVVQIKHVWANFSMLLESCVLPFNLTTIAINFRSSTIKMGYECYPRDSKHQESLLVKKSCLFYCVLSCWKLFMKYSALNSSQIARATIWTVWYVEISLRLINHLFSLW